MFLCEADEAKVLSEKKKQTESLETTPWNLQDLKHLLLILGPGTK